MNQALDIEPLLYLMRERHLIYLRRRNGDAKPWSQDPIFQNNRFCNTYRELDKVTVWVRQYIREPYQEHNYLWFLLAAARQINWPETLSDLLADKNGALPIDRDFNPAAMRAVMLARQERGEKVYTGAYMISASSKTKDWEHKDKSYFTAYKVLAPLWRDRLELGAYFQQCGSIQATVERLSKYQGWGGFMSYEVATDMRWTRYLHQARDICTYANPGPGAKRGLNRIFGRPVDFLPSAPQAINEMQMVYQQVLPLWPEPSDDWPALEMREIEHSLCEFDKYQRVKNKQGRTRAKFSGGALDKHTELLWGGLDLCT